MKQISLKSPEILDTYLANNADVIYESILDSISEVYKYANKKEVKVLEIILEGSEVMTLNIERKDWIKSLRNAIRYFEKPDIEKYENCTKCIDIIKYISDTADTLNIIQNIDVNDDKIKDLI